MNSDAILPPFAQSGDSTLPRSPFRGSDSSHPPNSAHFRILDGPPLMQRLLLVAHPVTENSTPCAFRTFRTDRGEPFAEPSAQGCTVMTDARYLRPTLTGLSINNVEEESPAKQVMALSRGHTAA